MNKNCRVCDKPVSRKGAPFCSKSCSNRARAVPPEIRYWSDIKIGEPDECWLWLKAHDRYGYGVFSLSPKQQIPAHRYGYQTIHGVTLSSSQHVLHTCIGHRWCQNPMHWYLGGHAANTADKIEQNRQSFGENHGRAILTEADVREIQQRWQHGEKQTVIAADYPAVSRSTIQAICSGRNWQHVT